jgi:sterol desaturase/sphingolipid hydroxylase (fatty acid hydroxylase superfamily)
MLNFGFSIRPGVDAGWRDFAALWICCYAGLLLLYFAVGFVLQNQNRRHPERRIQSRPAKDQVSMEIRQSVLSLLSIAGYVAGGLFAQGKGWTMTPFALGWISAPLTFVASVVIYDTWFYWGHRLMHTRFLYRFHAHHHKSIVPTPWSNNSDTLVGAFVEQSYFLVAPFLLPIPLEVLLAHKIYDQVTGMIGHAGHEYFASGTARRPWPLLCTTFHDQHHGFFHYNFANTFSWWDRLMGTIHPSYDDTVHRFELLAQTAQGSSGGQQGS